MRILYIAGFGRSGSSILGNVLAQSERIVHVGEGRNLWDDGMLWNRRCGCRLRFSECPFWTDVVRDLAVDPMTAVRARDAVARTRHAARWILPQTRSFDQRVAEFVRPVWAAYESISRHTGAPLIVDSTMSPVYGRLLLEIPDVEVTCVHLVRDPRAVVNAWTRSEVQDDEDGVPMRRYSVGVAGSKWVSENVLVEQLLGRRAPTLRVTYEEFAADPRSVSHRILGHAGMPSGDFPIFGDDRSLDLPVSHTVWGNRSRFLTGHVRIGDDRRWLIEMPESSRRLVSLATQPWMRRYGYPNSPGTASS